MGTEALVVPGPGGGTLLPPGRTTDLPWLGIYQLVITLSGSQSLNRNEVTIGSVIGFNYGPTTVAGSGTTYAITLGRPVRQADYVSLAISGLGLTPVNGVLPILPGDFNDNGKVDYADETGVLNEWLGVTKPTVFGDINGDGVVNQPDYQYVVNNQGATLPPMRGLGSLAIVGASSGSGGGFGVGAAAVVPPPKSGASAATSSAPLVSTTASALVVPSSVTLGSSARIRLARQNRIRVGKPPFGLAF